MKSDDVLHENAIKGSVSFFIEAMSKLSIYLL